MVPLLLGLGVCLSLFLPKMATEVLLIYTALATAYTFWLKRKLLADVVTLALLYTVRIVEGGTATSLLVSPWLLAFSLFMFISLAFSKRVAEMLRVSATDHHDAPGRGYFVPDTATLASLGSVSGYLACLVLSFYINSDSVRKLYFHPGWLWLLLPLLLYWVGRIWILTMRGKMYDDPIIFMFKDLHTHFTVFLGGIILLLAARCPFGIPGVLE
jgi:4-hydroxybenzoate polyprenyltransferase